MLTAFFNTTVSISNITPARYYAYFSLLALHYQTLPFLTKHCRSLSKTAVHYQQLPFTTKHCRSLSNSAIRHYQTLPFTIKNSRSLSNSVVHYQTLPFTIKTAAHYKKKTGASRGPREARVTASN